MNDRKTLVTILMIVIIVLGVSSIYWFARPAPEKENSNLKPDEEPAVFLSGNREALKEEIIVANLADNNFISSPLEIKGQAKGSWFYEGEFAVRLVSEGGLVLGQGFAFAQTDWMTEGLVGFSAEIEFAPNEAQRGGLYFTKSNPAGLAEEEKELIIRVRFNEE